MRASRVFVSLSLVAMVVGCGGSDAAEPEPEEEEVATTGGEAEPEPEPVVEPEPEPEPTGPGQIRVVNVVSDQEVGGPVRVLDSSGEVVAEGTSGDTFNVESGEYRVQGEVTDASILVDTPTQETTATVPAGGTTEARVDFPVSRIRIEVTRGGRPIARWRLTVRRQGMEAGDPVELEPSREHVPITPGRYDATLRFGGSEIEVNGLIFQGGATMTVPVNVN